MNTFLYGLEPEFRLVDETGTIVDRAEYVISNPLNNGNLVPEFTESVVEANPSPSHDLGQIEKNLTTEISQLVEIVDSMGLFAIPLSDIGPDQTTKRVKNCRRYDLFEQAVGELATRVDKAACSTHLHIDHLPNLKDQFNLYQSMDSVFALMSSTAYYMGTNTVNCGRLEFFRNKILRSAPFMNQLLDYTKSKEDIESLRTKRTDFFLDKLGDNDETRSIFGGYNNGSSPIRKTDKTIEIRCADATTPSFSMSFAATYKGVTNYVFGKGLEIKISEKDDHYEITDSEIFLPSYPTLKAMEVNAIISGVTSPIVHKYLTYLIGIAESGLQENDRKYLEPFKAVLASQRNLAGLIEEYVKVRCKCPPAKIGSASAKNVNLFVKDLFYDELAGGEKALHLIKKGL